MTPKEGFSTFPQPDQERRVMAAWEQFLSRHDVPPHAVRDVIEGSWERWLRENDDRPQVPWEELAPTFDDRGQNRNLAVDRSRGFKDPAVEAELKSVLCGAIAELPADYRTPFLLHDVEGLSNAEIAETLQVKLGTVKSRVHRARLFLQKRMKDHV